MSSFVYKLLLAGALSTFAFVGVVALGVAGAASQLDKRPAAQTQSAAPTAR